MFDKLLSKHMKIERMSVICIALALCMSAVLIVDGVSIYKSSKVQLSNEAVLTPSTITSLTNQSFQIDAVYENEEKTQAMIVLNGDLSNVSYLADAYQVFVDGKSGSLYSGGVYAFGELNKLCVYVTNSDGFKQEQTQFIIRCLGSTGQRSKTANEVYIGDSPTYGEYDQMSLYVNLGASETRTVSFLDDSGVDVEKMAESAFAYDNDSSLRESLTELQTAEVDAKITLGRLQKSLDGVNIQRPTLPDWAADDSIETRENMEHDYVKTSYVFQGLADFDWENATRMDDYAKLANVSVDDLLSEDANAEDVITEENAEKITWYYTDNAVIKTPTSSESSLMTQYTSALAAFKSAKYSYQKGVAELIKNQSDHIKGVQNYTSNIGADVIISLR